MTKKEKFSIDYQFKFYLKKVSLKEEDLPEVLLIEMKRAFYGSSGIILNLLTEDIADLPEGEGEMVLAQLINEVKDFWKEEMRKSKKSS